jgi:hypothetical protein
VIYSRWRPDKGGYDYFESGERFGLGDDLPTPKLPGGSSIGVSSLTAGRMPNNGTLKPVGSGPSARGMIMPTSRDGLEGLGVFSNTSTWSLVALAALAGALIGRFIDKRRGI